jgi:hypothetical protein
MNHINSNDVISDNKSYEFENRNHQRSLSSVNYKCRDIRLTPLDTDCKDCGSFKQNTNFVCHMRIDDNSDNSWLYQTDESKWHGDSTNSKTTSNKRSFSSTSASGNNSCLPKRKKNNAAKLLHSCQKILLSQQCQPKGKKAKDIRISKVSNIKKTGATCDKKKDSFNKDLKQHVPKTVNGNRRQNDSNDVKTQHIQKKNIVKETSHPNFESKKRSDHRFSGHDNADNNNNHCFDIDEDVVDEWQSNFMKLLSLPIKIDHGIVDSDTATTTTQNSVSENILASAASAHPAALIIKSYYDTDGSDDIQDWIISQCHLYHIQNQKHNTSHAGGTSMDSTSSSSSSLLRNSSNCANSIDTKQLTSSSSSMRHLMVERDNEQFANLQNQFRFNLLRLIGLDLTVLPLLPPQNQQY